MVKTRGKSLYIRQLRWSDPFALFNTFFTMILFDWGYEAAQRRAMI
jgi:hypothetical protein